MARKAGRAENQDARRGDPEQQLSEDVQRKAHRRLIARRQPERGPLYWVALFGLVGWAVAVPAVAGVAAGIWLDNRFEGEVSWTLTMLFLGVIVGCVNAWYWVRRESRDDGQD